MIVGCWHREEIRLVREQPGLFETAPHRVRHQSGPLWLGRFDEQVFENIDIRAYDYFIDEPDSGATV